MTITVTHLDGKTFKYYDVTKVIPPGTEFPFWALEFKKGIREDRSLFIYMYSTKKVELLEYKEDVNAIPQS